MVRVGVVGLGKMGLSHLSMIKAHPNVVLGAVCDSSSYVLDVLEKYTGVRTFRDFQEMLEKVPLDAVVISTPPKFHADMVGAAVNRKLHVFCEKPFVLDLNQGKELARMAGAAGIVHQAGYHYRYVAAFEEAKRLLDAGALGTVTHALAEAYGPVVLRPKGSTWRSHRTEGGGCLYDYAAHPIDLLNWFFGRPETVSGTTIKNIFSRESDDEVYSSVRFSGGTTAQISVNWSDESCRKMTTKITLWGTSGRLYVDRQEVQAYLRDPSRLVPGYQKGWNVRYTTELTPPVWFYVRGEEYSRQLDDFLTRIEKRMPSGRNSFDSAVVTDEVITMMMADARQGACVRSDAAASLVPEAAGAWRRFSWPSLASRAGKA